MGTSSQILYTQKKIFQQKDNFTTLKFRGGGPPWACHDDTGPRTTAYNDPFSNSR